MTPKLTRPQEVQQAREREAEINKLRETLRQIISVTHDSVMPSTDALMYIERLANDALGEE